MTLEAIQRPLTALEQLIISDNATYSAAKPDLQKTGVVESINQYSQVYTILQSSFSNK